jgi:hypothetical protein
VIFRMAVALALASAARLTDGGLLASAQEQPEQQSPPDQPPETQNQPPAGQPAAQPAPPAAPATPQALNVARVLELLRARTPSAVLVRMIETEGGAFDLTVEDIARLRHQGASTDLVLAMALHSTVEIAAPAGAEPIGPAAPTGAAGSLTVKRVLKMYKKAVPPEEIAAQVAQLGLKEPPDLGELLDSRQIGVPALIIQALAHGGAASPAPAATSILAPAPASVADASIIAEEATAPGKKEGEAGKEGLGAAAILEMLREGIDNASIVAAISKQGLTSHLDLDEILSLREAGAGDEVITAINRAEVISPDEVPGGAPEGVPAREKARAGRPVDTPTADTLDRVWIASIPSGARVFISPAATRRSEIFDHDHFAGSTPLTLSLDPGEYNIVVRKEAAAFERDLVPAWRTLQDTNDTRTMLDNAHLIFDPTACCLPTTLTGTVDVYPIPKEQSGTLIGDQFGGLPPYLFDGESFQVMEVRKARIRGVMKIYPLHKIAGRSRLLVSTFLPAEGNPLDQDAVAGLPPGEPYAGYLETSSLDFLSGAEGVSALALALGVDADQLGEAVAMLRRAGKAILHQQIAGGFRLLSLSLDDDERLRLSDRIVSPVDPFAPPPPPVKRKKKVVAPPPPPPPPLPAVERVVSPGQGLPRLVVENNSSKGLGLLLDDGLFLFVPARTSRDFPVDPGTYDVRILDGMPPGTSPRGKLHFAYHARYSIKF